jgi:16S rRNA processing protein RimM
MSQDNVVVGRLGRSFGVKGWQHLQSFTSPRDNLLSYQPWFLRSHNSDKWQRIEDYEIQNHNDGYLVRLAGVEQRETAQKYSGSLLGTPAEMLGQTADGEFYWHQLIGCDVLNEQGEALGQVIGLLETGAHDVLQIARQGQPLLVPFADPYIIDVNLAERRIMVMWPSEWND